MKNIMFKNQVIRALVVTASSSLFLAASADAADYSTGLSLGSGGLGVSVTKRSELSFREGDQIQWRGLVSGFSFDDEDDIEISSTDYEGDGDLTGLVAGLNWYPASTGFAKNFFLSGGLTYFDESFNLTSEDNQTFSVGGTSVNPADAVSLEIDADQSSIAPYLSLGWGNRLKEEGGFAFTAEIGVLTPLSDADVNLTLTDPNDVVTQQDFDRERRQVEDEFDGVFGFAMIGVSYQF